ncbi:MAG: hypothetical protein JO250_03795 [Armatimonadetes bacterium]|nr:hypothetical protein [Armatimonadota bacterium]
MYTPVRGRVNFDIAITNRSGDVLSGVLVRVLTLKFPGGVTASEDDVRAGSNVDSPTVVGGQYGNGTLAVANDDVARPLYVGLPSGDPKKPGAVFPLLAATYRDDVFPRPWVAAPPISRPVYPGETDPLHLSLRAGPPRPVPDDLAADVYRRYAAAFPFRLSWQDRRPIGYLNLCTTVPHPASGKNPRGWFNNDPTVDVTTPEGRQSPQARLLDLADRSIPLLKATNAQGVIIWDIEGQEYPHAMSYVGDPRHLPAEVDPVADRFFQKFRDAGLRVGVCLRPQKPMKTLYADVPEQVQVADNLYNLNDKIAYAKKRWGCTLFYVDSNVHFDPGPAPVTAMPTNCSPPDCSRTRRRRTRTCCSFRSSRRRSTTPTPRPMMSFGRGRGDAGGRAPRLPGRLYRDLSRHRHVRRPAGHAPRGTDRLGTTRRHPPVPSVVPGSGDGAGAGNIQGCRPLRLKMPIESVPVDTAPCVPIRSRPRRNLGALLWLWLAGLLLSGESLADPPATGSNVGRPAAAWADPSYGQWHSCVIGGGGYLLNTVICPSDPRACYGLYVSKGLQLHLTSVSQPAWA